MNAYRFTFAGSICDALPSGALSLPDQGLLCVSDLHLGKSNRIARRSGTLIPPYENRATIDKLAQDIALTAPREVLCLGDSFDDLTATDSLDPADRTQLLQLQAGRKWLWAEGNHDPGPIDLGGTHVADYHLAGIAFRHIASADTPEVSGHYHPKLAIPGAGRARACLVMDDRRIILPAYGAYTGGLSAQHPDLRKLFNGNATAVLTGKRALPVRLP